MTTASRTVIKKRGSAGLTDEGEERILDPIFTAHKNLGLAKEAMEESPLVHSVGLKVSFGDSYTGSKAWRIQVLSLHSQRKDL